MAKTIVDEKLKYDIIINGDKAKKELYELEDANRKLNQSNKDLRKEKTRLEAANKKESAEYKRVTAALKENNAAIKSNDARMKELRNEIGITGLTLAQLKKEADQLRLAWRHMTPGSAQQKQATQRLAELDARMKQLGASTRATGASMGRMTRKVSAFRFATIGVIASVTGATLSFRELIKVSTDLADAWSGVEKTTNLSKEQVRELTKELDKIDTRKSRVELLKLAEEAGRLGKDSVEDVLGFVNAANQISVALGDELGSDEAIREIGKLTEIYRVGQKTGKDFEQSMLAVGSAINEVAMAGPNTAKYQVDYLKRTAGIANTANIAAEANIGFAATFDEIGQSVEVAGTAMNKVMIDMFQDAETYAKIAGMSLDDFRTLMDKDANEAMLRFLEGLNGSNDGLEIMAHKLKDIEVGGARGAQALAAIAGNVDKVRERQALATKALEEATSVTDEHNKVNNNLAANWEKLGKIIKERFIGSGLMERLENFFEWLVTSLKDSDSNLRRFLRVFKFLVKTTIVATTAFLSYKAALKLATLWSQRHAASTWLMKVAYDVSYRAQALYIIGTNLLTGKIKLATAAQRAWNVAMAMNPVGAITALVVGAVAAYAMFSREQEKLSAEQRAYNDITEEANKNVASQKVRIESLVATIKNENVALETRKKKLEQLKSIAPGYLDDIEIEEINTQRATSAINDYIDALTKKAKIQAAQEKLVELEKQKIDLLNGSYEKNLSWFDKLVLSQKTVEVNREGAIKSIEREIEAVKNLAVELQKVDKTDVDQMAAEFNSKMNKALQIQGLTSTHKSQIENLKKESEVLIAEMLSALENGQTELFNSAHRKFNILGLSIDQITARYRGGSEELTKNAAKNIQSLYDEISKIQRDLEMDALGADERELARIDDKYEALLEKAKQYITNKKKLEEVERQLAQLKQWEFDNQAAQQEEKSLKEREDFRKRFVLKSREELHQEELRILKDGFDKGLISLQEYLEAKKRLEDEFNKKDGEDGGFRRARATMGLQGTIEALELEREELAKHYAEGKISFEEYQRELSRIQQQHQNTRIQQLNVATQALNTLVQSRKESELAALGEVVRYKNESEDDYTRRKEEHEAKRIEILKDYADKDFAARLGQIIADTASGIARLYADLPIWGAIAMTPVLAGVGAAQYKTADAERQKIKGLESGLYPVQDQHGRNFNARKVANAPTGKINDPSILVGEKPEIIIDPRTTNALEMNYPQIIDSIYHVARKVRGYESGHYPSKSTPTAPTPNNEEIKVMMAMMQKMDKTLETLNTTLKTGIAAYYSDEEVRNIEYQLEQITRIRNQNTISPRS